MSIDLKGAPEIYAKMARVGKEVADKINRAAVRKALTPVVNKARALAPVGKGVNNILAGMLRDSIEARISVKKGVIRGIAGPTRKQVRVGTRKKGKRKGSAVYKDPARYAHLVEFGTSHSAAKPFLRPAWEAEGAEKALDVYQKELSDGLDKAIKKLRK